MMQKVVGLEQRRQLLERSWLSDFKLENGNYFNICCSCDGHFVGHKRRYICRKCSRESEMQGKPTLDRMHVYAIIDEERDYQDKGTGNSKRHEGQPDMTPGEFILCMEKCLEDARVAWYAPNGGKLCLEFIRKTTAVGVQCMEKWGAPHRKVEGS